MRSLRGVAGRAKAAACLSAGLVAAPVATWAAPDLYAAGKPVFDRLCGGCHQVGIGAVNGVGPQLNGVTGRPAGLVADYRYSPRMARSGVVWTPASLDAFIADPRADMPGTRMMVPGVASDRARRAIVTYLGRYRADGHLRSEP